MGDGTTSGPTLWEDRAGGVSPSVDGGTPSMVGEAPAHRCVLGAQDPIARTLVSQECGNATLAVQASSPN